MKRSVCLLAIFFILFQFTIQIHAQWVKQINGLPSVWESGMAIDACDINTAVILLFGPAMAPSIGGVYRTIDGGKSWTTVTPKSISEEFIDVSIIDKDHFWITTDAGKIYATIDSGQTWIQQYFDTTKTRFMNYIKMFDRDNGIAMGDAVGSSSVPLFLKTTNGGSSWISVNNDSIGGWSGDIWRRLDFINKDTGYFFESGNNPQKLFKTTDGGAQWVATNYPATLAEVIKFYDEKIGLAIADAHQIYRTIDGGIKWENFSSPHDQWGNDIEFLKSDPSKVWLVDLSNLYFSSDTGRTWTKQMSAKGRDIVFADKQHGWLLTDIGVYRTENNGGVTSIEIDRENIPREILLSQNFPNPFDDKTTIEFSLPQSGSATIKVFNSLGQEAATIQSSYLERGIHRIRWNPNDLPDGIYFYRLQINNRSEVRAMIYGRGNR